MPRSYDRRKFLKGLAVLAAAGPVATLAADGARAAEDPAPAAKPETPPAAPATYGPDFSICRSAEERALLERQYASALEVAQTIRKATLPPGVEPATTFAALSRGITVMAPPPVPAPETPAKEETR